MLVMFESSEELRVYARARYDVKQRNVWFNQSAPSPTQRPLGLPSPI